MATQGTDSGALKILFRINGKYDVGSDKYYTFCYLADPFVDGPARSDFNSKKLSAMKQVFQNQYGDEAVPLMCMILLACGDSKSSDLLKKYAPSPFAGEKVKEEKRILYNFRCLLVSIASKLDSKSKENMVELMQEELQTSESVESKPYQTVLLLLERAHQASVILPQKLTQLEEWLGVFERDDLIRSYVNQFDPKTQFPGYEPIQEQIQEQIQEPSTNPPDIERQCSETTGQMSTTVPNPSQPVGAIGTLAKHPSLDSAYAEGDSRSRSSSHGDQPSLASYGSSDQFSRFRSDSTEEKGPREAAEMVSGLNIKQQPH